MPNDLNFLEMRLATQPKKSEDENLLPQQIRMLNLWSELNKPFEENLFSGNRNLPHTISIKKSNKVLLVSVHGISHFYGRSNDDYKIADLNTGGLVRLLQSELYTSSVINYNRSQKNNPWLGWTDANKLVAEFLSSNPYGLVLDIHGCKDNHNFDLALGTCIGSPNDAQNNVIHFLLRLSNKYGIRIALNPPSYQAKTELSITGRAILDFPDSPILQLEIARSFRCPQEKNQKSALLADFLHDAIAEICNPHSAG
jgi:hypothetical protein